jgi:predicted helicase
MPNATNHLTQQLAQLAHKLRAAIAIVLHDEHPHGSLHQQMAALRRTFSQTGLPAITPDEFADMYAQTLVYGLFAARVATPAQPTFTRSDAAHTLRKTNPFLQEWFSMMAAPWLDKRIASLIDDCARLLQRTDISEVLHDFGKATKQQDPIMHFYETFLTVYDPRTRGMRGVYYTPEPIVSYMVRSVDQLLHTHFDKPLGLADDDTIIFDPATGTATFLHAIVQHIHATLHHMGMADTWNQYVPTKLLPRLYGFELLMTPYTIAHLKLRLLLQQTGYPLRHDDRLGIYLTNALSVLPEGQSTLPGLDFILTESNRARQRTQAHPIMVVLGNPPYANFGMLNKGAWIQQQLEDYKRGLQEKKLNLDDAFIKFMRLGQWGIEQAGQGVLAFITNNTYIDGITHRRMRESLMATFSDIYILDLHGSSLKKEVCPDGMPDENVFDIRQGVAIGFFVKAPGKRGAATVHHHEMWGTRHSKYKCLAAESVATTPWQTLHPTAKWFFFVPRHFTIADEYMAFPKLTDMFLVQQNVIKTDRDRLFFADEYAVLEERIRTFYSDKGLCSPFRETYRVEDSSSYKILARRQKTAFNPTALHRALYRPFDVQWMYYAPALTSRPAWEVMQHMLAGDNIALLGMRQYEYDVTDYCYALVTEHITESRVFISNRGGASIFPLYCYPSKDDRPAAENRRPNLAPAFIHEIEQRLHLTFIPDGTGDLSNTIGPEDILHYLYAILHSSIYRSRYAEWLKIDFPCIPITSDTGICKTLVAHGAALVDLHLLRLTGSDGAGGTGGAGGADILANPAKQGITQHGVTTGAIENISYHAPQQRVIIGNGTYFAGIEPATWAMQIGGYQPLHKWLKDRKGRTLSSADTLHYMRMVIALRETRRVMAAIDAVVGAWLLR